MNDTVRVLFQQQWSTSTFADRGPKVMTLRKGQLGFVIIREEMLASKVLATGEANGICAAGLRKLSEDAPGVRFFADLASRERETHRRWATVASPDDANRRADDDAAWEIWALVIHEGWSVAVLSMTSPSGDWVRASDFCFRPDGTVAQATDSYRTFYSLNGLVNDTVSTKYGRDGEVMASKADAYYMETGRPADSKTYMRPPPSVVRKLAELPFYTLFKP